jgi:hypothetical protein
MRLAKSIVARLWDRRRLWLLLGIAVAVGLGINLRQLGVDNAIDIWFLKDDPALLEYQQFQQRFGHDEVVIIALKDSAGMLTAAGIDRSRMLSAAIEHIDGIARVDSLLTLKSPGDGTLLPAAGLTQQESAAFARRLLADPELRNRWISADGKLLVLVAGMDARLDIDAERERILAELRTILDADGGAYHLAGLGVIYSALNRAATQDSALVTASAYGLILLLLALIYQRARPLLVIIAIAALGGMAAMGAYAASGRDLNMVTVIIPTLILVTSVSTSVHLILSIVSTPVSLPVRERIIRGVGHMFWPCLINTLTTMAGFLSLMSSPMPVIYDLGLFAALGLMFTFVLSLLVTVAFSVSANMRSFSALNHRVGKIATLMATTAIHRPRAVGGIAALIALVAAFGMLELKVDTYSIEFLFADHPVRQDSAAIERELGPYMALDFTVERADGALREDILDAVANWQLRTEDAGLAGWSNSAASHYRQLKNSGLLTADVSPDSLARLFAAERSDLVHDGRILRVQFGVPMQSAREIENTIDAIGALAGLPDGYSARPAGYLPLYVQMMTHIVETQLQSFALAFGLIMLVLALLFRSAQQLLLIAISNLLPVLILLGAMGWLGIRLDAATVTIAAVVLGLVVDDTVQFLYRYREERKRADTRSALLATAESIGHAMTITTLVIMLGFSVLGLAAIKSVVFFGLLIALAMLAALLTDLMLLPALLVLWRSRESV